MCTMYQGFVWFNNECVFGMTVTRIDFDKIEYEKIDFG